MILHLQKVVGIAGAEHYLMALLPALQQYGIEVGFLGLVPEYDYPPNLAFFEHLEDHGVKTSQVIVGEFPTPRAAFEVAKISRRFGAAAIHSHLLFSDVVAVQARVFEPRLRVVSTKHGFRESHMQKHSLSPNVDHDWYWVLAKATELFVERSFAVSQGLQQLYIHSGIASSSMDVIYHGVLPGLHKCPSPLEGDAYRRSKVQIVVPGRLVPLKGQEFAIRAFRQVLEVIPHAHLILIGDGPSRNALEALVEGLQISNNVSFLGWRKDIMQWMLNSDLAIVPSLGEGFGLVFLEAYQAGLPVVAFDVSAGNEIVEDGVTGLLVPLGDSAAMGTACLKILKDPKLGSAMKTRSTELLKQRFSFERVVDETVDFYRRAGVLGDGP